MKTDTIIKIKMLVGDTQEIPALKISERFAIHRDVNSEWYKISDIETGVGIIKGKTLKDIKYLGEIVLNSFNNTSYVVFDNVEVSKTMVLWLQGKIKECPLPLDVRQFMAELQKNLVDCSTNFLLAR